MGKSVTIIEDRNKYAAYTGSSGLRGTYETKQIRKRWNEIPPDFYDSGNPTLPSPPIGSYWVPTAYIKRNRSRCATSHDDPQEVGFARRKKLGLYIPPNSYYSDVQYQNISYLSGYTGGAGLGPGIPSEFYNGLPVSVSSLQTAALADATGKFWAHARNRTVVETGVLLAELRQTIGMCASAVLTLTEVLLWLKRGRFDKAVEALIRHGVPISRSARHRFRNYSESAGLSLTKWVSNAWLELQFGWKPLLQDVYNLVSQTTTLMDGKYFPTLTLRGHGSSFRTGADSYFEAGYYYDTSLSNLTYSIDYSVTALFKVDETLTIANALGLDNPASIAWELVPFSFVVDWFLPINKYLSNLSALNGLTLIHCTLFRREVTRCNRETFQRRTGGYSITAECGRVYYSRTKLSEVPPPQFEFPNLSKLIDGWKFTTALSLLEQRRPR